MRTDDPDSTTSFRTAPIFYVRDLSELILAFSPPQVASMPVGSDSARFAITEYQMRDAEDLFSCISPAMTTFMPWDPPYSVDDLEANRQAMAGLTQANDFSLVVRAVAARTGSHRQLSVFVVASISTRSGDSDRSRSAPDSKIRLNAWAPLP